MPQFSLIQSIFLVISSVILFIYGLQHFARELQAWGNHRLATLLERWTKYRILGFLLGAFSTGLIQSSSAVSSIIIALVDSNVLTFTQSLTVLIGTNVGTVITAQLVAFKLMGIGPIFIVIGFLLGLKKQTKLPGRSIFYFGFILFALDLINTSLTTLNNGLNPSEYLLLARDPLVGILAGALVTIFVQSSSVTTGLIILLVEQQMLTITGAIPMILGANIGTTSTGLIVAIALGRTAKLTALANFLFNILGVLILLPFLSHYIHFIKGLELPPAQAAAQAHLWFNLVNALIFLVLLKPFRTMLMYLAEKIWPDLAL